MIIKSFFPIMPLALGLLLAAAAPALAQTPAAPKTQVEQGTGIASTGKAIPAAQYYEGGQAAMYDFIAKELKYPATAVRNRIQGRCQVSFTLNADGTTSEFILVQGKTLGGGVGDEALRVAKLLKFKAPLLPFKTSIPIDFRLGKASNNIAPGQ